MIYCNSFGGNFRSHHNNDNNNKTATAHGIAAHDAKKLYYTTKQNKTKNQNKLYGAFNVHIVVTFCGLIKWLVHLFTCTAFGVDIHSHIVCARNALLFNQPHYFYIKIGMCATTIIDVQCNIKVCPKSISNRLSFVDFNRDWPTDWNRFNWLARTFLYEAFFLTILVSKEMGQSI